MKATYTKLSNGDWGVLCDERPNVGDLIVVTKKNGDTKTETIAQVWMRGDKFACAVLTDQGGPCAQCGRYSNKRSTRYDMSGISGLCCEQCAKLSKYDLSFG